MIGFIKGEVIDTSNNTVILENGGIGYEITVSNNTLVEISKAPKFVKLYTFLNVKEDGIFLYGFFDKQEKEMFLKLITVSGVGPKAAMSVLSGMSLSDLGLAIMTSDAKAISQIKGIGKKTSERIILELRGSITVEESDCSVSVNVKGKASGIYEDAVSALRNLGISPQDAERAVQEASKEVTKIEDIIALALRKLG